MSHLEIVHRIIQFDGRELTDLNPTASVEDVVKLHALTNPQLVTAVVEGPVILDGKRVYTVQKRAANKG
ncbi:PRTRC system protein C [Deinococcus multiflagellatus]|uniref:PRTRC system protein C n=1 Tax=Deinococcus multiflagellatus TaxID=1656887 RepID=A0ABW1ZQB8_9DEIO|nr:PRTRC system protein C [Deinococcus multiflagellatus]MBZ9714884.1 PRTRC system protein C [Deinococcus multiflagellatus]